MPYKVQIANNQQNIKFLKNIPENILPKLLEHLKVLGEHPYLGRSKEGVIPAYVYSFNMTYQGQVHNFIVTYKIDENTDTIYITGFGKQIITSLNS